MKKVTNFLSGFALGVILGGVTAILLAPSSGDDLRLTIQQEVERVQSDVKKAAEERRAELESQLDSLRTPYTAE